MINTLMCTKRITSNHNAICDEYYITIDTTTKRTLSVKKIPIFAS